MNRKALLIGIAVIFGVGLYFFLIKSKKQDKHQQSEMASTSTHDQIVHEEPSTIAQTEIQEANSKNQQVTSPKSGKYGIKISRPMPSIQNEIARRDQYLNQNRTDIVIQSADQSFVLMKLRASKEKTGEDRALGHEMFPVDQSIAQRAIVDEDSYAVVYRESSGRMGLLTGVILIQTERNEANRLAARYPIDLQIYDQSIGLASYKVRSGEGLFEIYNQIKQNERVRSITVEVLDSYKGI